MKTRAFIFARGGSKGIKDKNIISFDGKPLIFHSIKIAKQLKNIEKIYVSTDSKKISQVALRYGASLINRPAKLATDHSPEWLSWQHAIKYSIENDGDFERFISLPTTSPLRSIKDVKKFFNSLKSGVDTVITASRSNRNPWFNMIKLNKNGDAKLLINDKIFNNRQDAPICYDMTTVAYVSTPSFILKSKSIWDGRVSTVIVPSERAIDIDTKLDLEHARFLREYQKNKVNKFYI